MSKVIKELLYFILSIDINKTKFNEDPKDVPKIGFKINDFKNNYFTLIVLYLFFHSLIIISLNEYIFSYNYHNSTIFKICYVLYLYIYKNSISHLYKLDIFPIFINKSNIHEINNLLKSFFYFFIVLLHNSFLLIILISLLTIAFNKINTSNSPEKRIQMKENLFFLDKKKQIDLPSCNNSVFQLKNQFKDNLKLNYDNRKDYNEIEIIINTRNNRKKILNINKNYLKNFIEIINYIIFVNLFSVIYVINKITYIQYKSNIIILKIKGIGKKSVFSPISNFQTDYYPDQVFINDILQKNVTHTYYLDQEDNKIKLVWNELNSDCRAMFYRCKDITEFDFSNFDTSNTRYMNSMFSDCSSLTSLNLSNFDTSKVIYTFSMFSGCSSLTSLNLSNFDTSKVQWIKGMFENCKKLEYINMIKFDESSLEDGWYNDIFKNVPDNIVVCINKNKILNKIFPQIENITCHVEDCTNDWKLKQKKLIEGSNNCLDNCLDKQYEYNGKCYSNCSYVYLFIDNYIKCTCQSQQCLTCEIIDLNRELCSKCKNNYYPMENDPSNIGEYFNCYNKEPNGYYLDKDALLFKKCYHTCETCEMQGNITSHNCLKCKNEFNFEIKINNFSNCYEKCDYYYYFDNNNNYHCTNKLSCPSEYPQLIQPRNECIFGGIKYIENIIDDILNINTNETFGVDEKEIEINKYNKILEKIDEIFTSNNYDLTIIDSGEEQYINVEKMLITFTNIKNQKNNLESNMTTIDFGDCEKLLRNSYNLTINQTIYMKKIDIIQTGMKTKKIVYNVYSRLSGKNLEKLNITVCENTKIILNIPIEIDDNIDKLNTSSGYYNDICYTTTSNHGTDISLLDRKNEYINGDNIICQEDCEFSAYDSKLLKAKCECYTKESNSSFVDMIIDKHKIFANIRNIKNLVNLNILVCYKNLLPFSKIIHNVGSLIIIGIIIFHLISIFIFYANQLDKINRKIKAIIFGINNNNIIKNNKANIKIIPKKNVSKKIIKTKPKLNISKNNINKINKKFNININIYNKNNKKKNTLKYNNDELNELSYNYALIYDKRSFCRYYGALLKAKHNLIFSFCNSEDYNSRIIKMDLFFIGFTIEYTVNALFFDDSTMHEIYINKGIFDLNSQLPIALYSFLISMILNVPLASLGLPNEIIITFKLNQIRNGINKRRAKLINCIKLKFVFYFIISSIFLLFFWYYISMFGVIYKNTQYHLLKDTLISIGLSFLYPFVIYLFPGLFRIPSLSNPKNKRKCLYNFSKLMQSL